MAVYTYECPEGHRWDEFRSMTDDLSFVSEEPCAACSTGCGDPECCQNDVSYGKRVWNPGDMRPVFVGRGWARKDHKDASKP